MQPFLSPFSQCVFEATGFVSLSVMPNTGIGTQTYFLPPAEVFQAAISQVSVSQVVLGGHGSATFTQLRALVSQHGLNSVCSSE